MRWSPVRGRASTSILGQAESSFDNRPRTGSRDSHQTDPLGGPCGADWTVRSIRISEICLLTRLSRPPCEIGSAREDNKLSQNYKTVLFTTLSSIMDSAVEDRLITINPCKAKSIRRPTSPSSNIVVWPEDRLRAVQAGLSARFRIVCTVGAGCGLRQGEILGLSLDDIDEDGESLHVQRQIRVVDRTLVFALPKGGKRRRVPLSPGVHAAARAHEQAFPSTEVTLPWGEPGGNPVRVRLLVTGDGGRLYRGDCFHKVVWQGAFRAAGVKYRNRADGMHALRHFYASTLLAQGVSIKELAEYLGHSDPGFTLRTYTHLVPSSFERARLAIEGVFGLKSADGLEAA